MIDQEIKDHWKAMGLHFGYPDCCIEAFVTGVNKCDTAGKYKLQYTGYVPCKTCNETFTEEQMVATIEFNRWEEEPFHKSILRANNFKGAMGYD